jgi:thioredoxin 1
MATEELTVKGFNEFIKEDTVLVDFYAEWCMPCVMLSPIIEELSDKIEKVKFGKVNIDDNKEVAEKFGVMSIPTMILFKDGKEIDRIVGALPGDAIEEKLSSYYK